MNKRVFRLLWKRYGMVSHHFDTFCIRNGNLLCKRLIEIEVNKVLDNADNQFIVFSPVSCAKLRAWISFTVY